MWTLCVDTGPDLGAGPQHVYQGVPVPAQLRHQPGVAPPLPLLAPHPDSAARPAQCCSAACCSDLTPPPTCSPPRPGARLQCCYCSTRLQPPAPCRGWGTRHCRATGRPSPVWPGPTPPTCRHISLTLHSAHSTLYSARVQAGEEQVLSTEVAYNTVPPQPRGDNRHGQWTISGSRRQTYHF